MTTTTITREAYDTACTQTREYKAAMLEQSKAKLRAWTDEYRDVPGAEGLVQAIDRAAGFDAERRAEGQRKFWTA